VKIRGFSTSFHESQNGDWGNPPLDLMRLIPLMNVRSFPSISIE
jgi:hypothetical protein